MKSRRFVFLCIVFIVVLFFFFTHYSAENKIEDTHVLTFIRERVGILFVSEAHRFTILPEKTAQGAGQEKTFIERFETNGRAALVRYGGRDIVLSAGHVARNESFVDAVSIHRKKEQIMVREGVGADRVRYDGIDQNQTKITFRLWNVFHEARVKFSLHDEYNQDLAILELAEDGEKKIPEGLPMAFSTQVSLGDRLFIAGGDWSYPAAIFLIPAHVQDSHAQRINALGSIIEEPRQFTIFGEAAPGASGSPLLRKSSFWNCRNIYCFEIVGVLVSIYSGGQEFGIHSHIAHVVKSDLILEALLHVYPGADPNMGSLRIRGIALNFLSFLRSVSRYADMVKHPGWSLFSAGLLLFLLFLVAWRGKSIGVAWFVVVAGIGVALSFAVFFGIRSNLGRASPFMPDGAYRFVHAEFDRSQKIVFLLVREQKETDKGELYFDFPRLYRVPYKQGSSPEKILQERMSLMRKGKGTLLRLRRRKPEGLRSPFFLLDDLEYEDDFPKGLPPKIPAQ